MGLFRRRYVMMGAASVTVFIWISINFSWTADISKKLRKVKSKRGVKISGDSRFSDLILRRQNQHGGHATASDIEGASETRKLPQCLIIGVRKGGTRALLDFLDIHPNIRSAGREIHFFDKDENYVLGLDWYRAQMPATSAGQITIEKTPKYFINHHVPERIAKMNSSIKLILIVRDPLERSVSDFAQLKMNGKGPSGFESAAINNETGEVNSRFTPIMYSLYYVHLRHWLKYFNLEQILVLSSEDFVKDPSMTLGQIEQFLHLPRVLTEDKFYFNTTKGFYCLKETSGLHGRKKQRAGCLGSSKGIEHPGISDDFSEKLRAFFQPFNEVFFATIHKNFHWS